MSPALVEALVLPETKTSDILESRLKGLLCTIQKTNLDPPLTVSDLDASKLDPLKPAATPDDYYKTSLETAYKAILYEIAVNQGPEENTTTVTFGNLLDCALICAELEIADTGLPFTLLEELFDTQTIPSCERLFNYLESRVERLTAGMEGGKGKALVLLRLCNELLRRLSKAEDTIFCGRILIFLSKSFPISERSAVNLRGDFNVENVTAFDDIPHQLTPDDSMDVDVDGNGTKEGEMNEKENDSKDGGSMGGDKSVISSVQKQLNTDKLYTTFWSLQNDFADPTRLFVPDNFERFKNGLAATMSKFREADEESVKTTGGTGKHDSGGQGKKHDDIKLTNAVTGEKRKREELEDEETKGEGFNPKYLTSRELFELEICDLTFRRNVLVQAMILLDFLLSLTPAAKEKWKDLKFPNRSVQYTFTLNAEDEAWATKTKNEISSSLQPDQHGRLFMRLINTVLTREQNWVHWKAEGCHKFDILPLKTEEFVDSKSKASNYCKPERPFPYVMGTPTLNRLWQDTGKQLQVDDLEEEERRHVPSVESFREGVDKDLEELKDAMHQSDIEEGQNAIQTKTWKALRLATHTRFHLFNRFDERFDETRNDLKMLADLEEKSNEEIKAKANQHALQAQTQAQTVKAPA